MPTWAVMIYLLRSVELPFLTLYLRQTDWRRHPLWLINPRSQPARWLLALLAGYGLWALRPVRAIPGHWDDIAFELIPIALLIWALYGSQGVLLRYLDTFIRGNEELDVVPALSGQLLAGALGAALLHSAPLAVAYGVGFAFDIFAPVNAAGAPNALPLLRLLQVIFFMPMWLLVVFTTSTLLRSSFMRSAVGLIWCLVTLALWTWDYPGRLDAHVRSLAFPALHYPRGVLLILLLTGLTLVWLGTALLRRWRPESGQSQTAAVAIGIFSAGMTAVAAGAVFVDEQLTGGHALQSYSNVLYHMAFAPLQMLLSSFMPGQWLLSYWSLLPADNGYPVSWFYYEMPGWAGLLVGAAWTLLCAMLWWKTAVAIIDSIRNIRGVRQPGAAPLQPAPALASE